MLFERIAFETADLRSMILVMSDWEGRVSDRGGLRRDFRVTVMLVGGEEVDVEASRRRMGLEVRGRVYWEWFTKWLDQ